MEEERWSPVGEESPADHDRRDDHGEAAAAADVPSAAPLGAEVSLAAPSSAADVAFTPGDDGWSADGEPGDAFWCLVGASEQAKKARSKLCQDQEKVVRAQMEQMLRKKGLDPEPFAKFKVIVSKPHKRANDRQIAYSVTYLSPEGVMMQCRGDVVQHIEGLGARSTLISNTSEIDQQRSQVHVEQKRKTDQVVLALPMEFDGIRVINLGHVNPSTNFHTVVNVYPVSYECEICIARSKSKDILNCSIRDVEGCPEFIITNKTTGTTFWSSTEAGAWRKFAIGLNSVNIDLSTKSFFNLEIELLIEGLDQVLDCEDYKFHCERGYPSQYSNDEQLVATRFAFLTKFDREKRTKVRQEVRFLSSDEKKRRELYAKKKLAEDVEMSRENAAMEKARRDRDREAERVRREKLKDEARERKEAQKAKEEMSRNQKKDDDRLQRERQRAEERYRLSYRRSTNREVRTKREEMSMQVMRVFDEEEALLGVGASTCFGLVAAAGVTSGKGGSSFAAAAAAASASAASKQLALKASLVKKLGLGPGVKPGDLTADMLLSKAPLAHEHLKISSDVELDALVQMTNAARLLRGVLGLEFSCELEHLVDNLKLSSPRAAADGVSAMVVESTVLGEGQKNQAEAELERLQLCLVKKLMDNSNSNNILWMLDLGISNDDGMSSAMPTSYSRLPLNQLTWAEVARQALITHALSRLGRAWEETQSALRGSKVSSSYRQARNVHRMIRYRWQVRINAKGQLLPQRIELETGFPKGSIDKSIVFDKCQRLGVCNKPVDFVLPPVGAAEKHKNLFNTDTEIVNALAAAAADPSTPAIYARCMKVLMKVLSLSQAKSFMWPLEESEAVNYYERIKNPMFFSVVAGNLLYRTYSEEPLQSSSSSSSSSSQDKRVATRFYSDMNLVSFNSFAFNSEHGPFNSQAQKVWHAMSRHVQTWILTENPPPIAQCTEQFCLMSRVPIQANQGMRCGRCTGIFSLNSLGESKGGKGGQSASPLSKFVIFPSNELIHASQHEEWFCPLCLMEDSTSLAPASYFAYSFDEMGPSVMFPWQFNKAFSREAQGIYYNFPQLTNILEAISVLGASDRTPGVDKQPKTTSTAAPRTWSIADRVKVLLGLCEAVLQMPETAKLLEATHKDCNKLKKLCGNFGTFKEAEFVRTVKHVAGEEGINLCRGLVDMKDFESSEQNVFNKLFYGRCMACKMSTFESNGGGSKTPGQSEKKPVRPKLSKADKAASIAAAAALTQAEKGDAQNPLAAEDLSARPGPRGGRVSKQNSGDGDSTNQVLLCDGCTAEVHLKCLGLTAVPSEEWHCSNCEARSRAREAEKLSSAGKGKNAEEEAEDEEEDYNRFMNYKQKDLEDELVNRAIDVKAISDGVQVRNAEEILEAARQGEGVTCAYCGENESTGCSPMVLGMSRTEHDVWDKFGIDIVVESPLPLMDVREFRAKPGTKVYFAVQGNWVSAPALEMPYFPLVSSCHGLDLLEHCEESSVDPKILPVIVHEHCALEMFQARVSRTKHEMRRKRNTVAEQAVALSGVAVRPLGVDNKGREYWKFPTSMSLFMCTAVADSDADKARFLRSIAREGSLQQQGGETTQDLAALYDSSSSVTKHEWKVIASYNEIRVLAEMLCSEASQDQRMLGDAILRAFPEPIALPGTAGAGAAAADSSAAAQLPEPVAMAVDNEAKDDETDVRGGGGGPGDRDTPVPMDTDGALMAEDIVDGKKGAVRQAGAPADNQPVAIRLLTSKGQSIFPSYIINSETVFDESSRPNDDDNEEDPNLKTSEFVKFAKKYYAIELVNANDRRCRLPKGAVTISFQIIRDGVAGPIGHTPNPDPWTDGIYYFRTASFLRSGRYTLCFFVEGLGTAAVKPLIFEVVVQSKTLLCGPQCALELLIAQSFLRSEGRRSGSARRQALERRKDIVNSDIDAVRAALITVFLALPQGCLNMSENEEESLTAGLGWNDAVETTWIEVLETATHPTEIMECVLLLEACINKPSIQHSSIVGPIMNALPNPHFAIRCVTLSSVALRIYILDRVIDYAKFVSDNQRAGKSTSREARPKPNVSTAQKGTKTKAADQDQSFEVEGGGADRSSGRKKARTSYVEDDIDEEEES